VNINTLEHELVEGLGVNEIGAVTVEAKRPLFFDAYEKNRATGAFILIDPLTNETLAAGMITGAAAGEKHLAEDLAALELSTGRVTPAERYIRAGHRPVALWLAGDEELAYALERKLFDRGCLVHVLAGEGIVDAAKASADTGLISICAVPEEDVATRDAVQRAVGSDRFLAVNRGELPAGPDEAADALCRTLEDRAYIPRLPKPFTGGAGI
jgi:hypothetical protein